MEQSLGLSVDMLADHPLELLSGAIDKSDVTDVPARIPAVRRAANIEVNMANQLFMQYNCRINAPSIVC